MTDAELTDRLRVTDENVRQLVAQAAAFQDLVARQLSVLRNTYPSWDITREQDTSGQVWWTAELRPTLTAELAAAGVLRTVRQPDAIALAATLTWQSALLHPFGGRSRTGPL